MTSTIAARCAGGVLDLPAQAKRRLIMSWSRQRAEQERADLEHLLVAVIFEDLDSSVTPLAAGAGKSSLRRMEAVESDRGHLVAHRRQRQEELCKYREELKLSDSPAAFAGRGQGRFRITEGTGRVKVEVRASCAVVMRTGRRDWLGRRPWRWPQELVSGEGVGVDPLGGVQHVVYCDSNSTAKALVDSQCFK